MLYDEYLDVCVGSRLSETLIDWQNVIAIFKAVIKSDKNNLEIIDYINHIL